MNANTATYRTDADHAAEIRADLKAAGIKASVRTGRGGSITVRVKSGSVAKATAIAQPHEHVRYCEASGEILCGGNRFVSVSASDELIASLVAPILAAAEAATAAARAGNDHTIHPVAGTVYGVSWDNGRGQVWHLGEGTARHGCMVWDGAAAAYCIACNLADG
jgi:hypothetical protein